jgi:hypothetical protein
MISIPDPDKDILDKLDRRERRAEILAIAIALCGGLVVASLAYEILRHALSIGPQAAGDCTALIFILVTLGFTSAAAASQRRAGLRHSFSTSSRVKKSNAANPSSQSLGCSAQCRSR